MASAATPTPSPTAPAADPTCSRGIKDATGAACCPSAPCGGKCGGTGCGAVPKLAANCCVTTIASAKRPCSGYAAPCALRAPTAAPTSAKRTSAKPTYVPSAAPTALPTAAPTTAQPTSEPSTPEPTAEPTAEPTTEPSSADALTPHPTPGDGADATTPEPTSDVDAPTSEPTAPAPSTDVPTGVPTATPVAVEAPWPTSQTTRAPTRASDPYCTRGGMPHPNGDQCCKGGCTRCGKADCATDKLGADNCCATTIAKSGRSCDDNVAPCNINHNRPTQPPLRPAPVRRKTTVGMLAGPPTSMSQREKLYSLVPDAQLVYLKVPDLLDPNCYDMVAGGLDSGLKMQVVLEFLDSKYINDATHVNLDAIVRGDYDEHLKNFALKGVADTREIHVRPLHEFNGNWYPWGVFRKGNSLELFQQAYVHVVTLLRSFSPPFKYQFSYNLSNAGGNIPLAAFYVGDDYVDQICISVYNFAGVSGKPSHSLTTILQDTYDKLSVLGPPLCIAEMSTTSYGLNKPQWIKDTWDALAKHFTRITTINWFFENKTKPTRNWDLNTKASSCAV
ncbi:glycoside hydrolase superfamily [Tribonema minus]|uniref:Glycoside hydrolase superfamily n=1 Tax=Tribonema minus TaxID=303371 RepID=A0A836CCK2_9STRA|nr:glycoside hydrolase superfamily [Tribonema minus]